MSRKGTGFDFKQFSVEHDESTMKVGTDAVLLGSWANTLGANKILDIGTGSGIIALMLAQRTPNVVTIDAIEPDQESVIQARENIFKSPWQQKIVVHETTLQNFTSPYQFDLIVSNPPYFLNSQLPSLTKRSQARHTHLLSYKELIHGVSQLLNKHGRFIIILPTEEAVQFEKLATLSRLHVNRQLAFFSRNHKPQERWLLEFSFMKTAIVSETLVLHDVGENWSEAYKTLTRDFYLKL